ncbi:unnamed protein product [Meloidogyne enterolobii]|uniref:Uncharacterized protein n=1 Tax=Meloidogyne enterolobii TaxID=390850 RepID=A0ACB0YFX2_MELEN
MLGKELIESTQIIKKDLTKEKDILTTEIPKKEDLEINQKFEVKQEESEIKETLKDLKKEIIKKDLKESKEQERQLFAQLDTLEGKEMIGKTFSIGEEEFKELKTKASEEHLLKQTQQLQKLGETEKVYLTRKTPIGTPTESRNFKIEKSSSQHEIQMKEQPGIWIERIFDYSLLEGPIICDKLKERAEQQISFLCKVTGISERLEEKEKIILLKREWKDLFKTKAVKTEELNIYLNYFKKEEEEEEKIIKKAKLEQIIKVKLNSSKKENIQTECQLFNTKICKEETFKILKEKPLEEIKGWFREYLKEENMFLMDISFVDTQLWTWANLEEKEKAKEWIKTKAASDLKTFGSAVFELVSPEISTKTVKSLKEKEEIERKFNIEQSKIQSNLIGEGKEEDEFILKILPEKQKELTVPSINLKEFGKETKTTSILLVKIPMLKRLYSAHHLINIQNKIEKQQLNTLNSLETQITQSIQWQSSQPSFSIQKKFPTSQLLSTLLKTEYSKEELKIRTETLQKPLDWEKTELKIKTARKSEEKLKTKESREEEETLIAEYKIVERDLEIEKEIKIPLNKFNNLLTKEVSEEILNSEEKWERTEEELKLEWTLKLKREEKIERKFKIQSPLIIEKHLIKEGKEEVFTQKIIKIFREENLKQKIKEMSERLINVFVDFQSLTSKKDFSKAELYLKDKTTIKIPPIYLISHSENLISQFCLSRSFQFERIFKTIKIGRKEAINLKVGEANFEELKLNFGLQARLLAIESAQRILPLPNIFGPISFKIEEFEEEEVCLYTQLQKKIIKELDTKIDIPIYLKESQIMKTKVAGDEQKIICQEWKKEEKKELIEKVNWIAFKGEKLIKKLKEAGDEQTQIAYVFDKNGKYFPIPEKILEERRFGGNYILNTKATKKEEWQTTLSLNKLPAFEKLLKKLKYITKEERSMRMLESGKEEKASFYSLQKASETFGVAIKRKWAREMFPEIFKIKESTKEEFLINYELKPKMVSNEEKDELKINIPLIISGINLNTEASELIELTIIRELKRDEEFDRKEILIKIPNKHPEIIKQTKAATEENLVVLESKQKSEQHERVTKTFIIPNIGQENKLKTKEAKDLKTNICLEYNKLLETKESERIWPLAQFGGQIKLRTETASDEYLTLLRELESDHLRVAHTSLTIWETNKLPGVEMKMREAEAFEQQILITLQRQIVAEAAPTFKYLVRPHLSAQSELRESSIIEESITCQWKQPDNIENSEILRHIPAFGGRVFLHSKATGLINAIQHFQLQKQRDASPAPALRCIRCARELAPVQACLNEPKHEQYNLSQSWCREQTKEETTFTRFWPNWGPENLLKTKEAKEREENIHFQYSKLPSSAQTFFTKWEPRINKETLGTKAIGKEEYLKEETITKRKPLPDDLTTELVLWIARLTEPLILGSKASSKEQQQLNSALSRTSEFERAPPLIKICAREEKPEPFRVPESQAHSIMLSSVYLKDEQAEEAHHTVWEPLFDGQYIQNTKRAGDISTIVDVNLKDESPRQLSSEKIIFVPQTLVGPQPQYRSLASKTETLFLAQEMRSAPPAEMEALITLPIARSGPPLAPLHSHQAGTEQEHINTQWHKNDQISEIPVVLPDSLFGGTHTKHVLAAGDAHITLYKQLENPIVTQLEAECARPLERKAEPAVHSTKSSAETTISTTTALQRLEPSAAALPFKLKSSRILEGPTPSVHVTESREVEQLNNVQLRRPDQWVQAPDHTRWEPRYGGQFLHATKASIEKNVEVPLLDWLRPESVEIAPEKKIIIPRTGEPLSLLCSKAGDVNVEYQQLLEKPKSPELFTQLILRDINRIEPQIFKAKEASQQQLGSNIVLQKPQNVGLEAELIKREPRFGGHYTLNCAAADWSRGRGSSSYYSRLFT